jgi:cytidine deaminase
MDDLQLIELAREALHFAYAPYSGYKVGAALLTTAGKVFKGVNVENISYGLTICAERSALAAAVSNGHRSFTALAIVTESAGRPYPCGACRQVLSEFSKDLKIVVAAKGDEYETFTIGELLPNPFK